MKYKVLCMKHPLYGRIRPGENVNKLEDYKTFNIYLQKVRYFLDAAEKKGYSKAQNERAAFEDGLYEKPTETQPRYSSNTMIPLTSKARDEFASFEKEFSRVVAKAQPRYSSNKIIYGAFSLDEHYDVQKIAGLPRNRCF